MSNNSYYSDQTYISYTLNGLNPLFEQYFDSTTASINNKKNKQKKQINNQSIKRGTNQKLNNNNDNRYQYSIYNFINTNNYIKNNTNQLNINNKRKSLLSNCSQYINHQISALQNNQLQKQVFKQQSYEHYQDYKKFKIIKNKYINSFIVKSYSYQLQQQKKIKSKQNIGNNILQYTNLADQLFQQYHPDKIKQTQFQSKILQFKSSFYSNNKQNKQILNQNKAQDFCDILQQAYHNFDHFIISLSNYQQCNIKVKQISKQYIKNITEVNKLTKQNHITQNNCSLYSQYDLLLQQILKLTSLDVMLQLPKIKRQWSDKLQVQAYFAKLTNAPIDKINIKLFDDIKKLRKQRQQRNYVKQIFPKRSQFYFKTIYDKKNNQKSKHYPGNLNNSVFLNKHVPQPKITKQMPKNVLKVQRKQFQMKFNSPLSKNQDILSKLNIKKMTVPKSQEDQVKQKDYCKKVMEIPNKKIQLKKVKARHQSPPQVNPQMIMNNYFNNNIIHNYNEHQKNIKDSYHRNMERDSHDFDRFDTAKKTKNEDDDVSRKFEQQRRKITKYSKNIYQNQKDNKIINRQKFKIQFKPKQNYMNYNNERQIPAKRQNLENFMKIQRNAIKYNNNHFNQNLNNRNYNHYNRVQNPEKQINKNYQNIQLTRVNQYMRENVKNGYQTPKKVQSKTFNNNQCEPINNNNNIKQKIQIKDINKKEYQRQSKRQNPKIQERNLITLPYKAGLLITQSIQKSYLQYNLDELDLKNLAIKFVQDRQKYGQNNVHLIIDKQCEQDQQKKGKVFKAMDIIDFMGGCCIIKEKLYFKKKYCEENVNKIKIASFISKVSLSDTIKLISQQKYQ